MIQKLKPFGYFLTAVSLIYLVRTFWGMRQLSFSLVVSPRLLLFIPTAAILCASLIALDAYGWKLSLSFLKGSRIPYLKAFDVFARCNLAKYLPGNFMHFVGRNFLGSDFGTPVNIALSSLIEIALVLLAASSLLLALSYQKFFELVSTAAAHRQLVPLAALGLAIAVYWLTKQEEWSHIKHLFSFKFFGIAAQIYSIYTVQLFTDGIILCLLLALLSPRQLDGREQRAILLASVFSWLGGFIVPGSPAGLGVREVILLQSLGPHFGQETTVLAAAAARVVNILGDIFSFGGSSILKKTNLGSDYDRGSAPHL